MHLLAIAFQETRGKTAKGPVGGSLFEKKKEKMPMAFAGAAL